MTIRAEAKRLEILQSKEGRKRRLKNKKVDINVFCTLQEDLYLFTTERYRSYSLIILSQSYRQPAQ